MKIYVLNTGYLETDKNNVEAGATIGTLSNPEAMNGYWPVHQQEIHPLKKFISLEGLNRKNADIHSFQI